MLENVFIELYQRGVLLFLDINSYCKNTENADIDILKGRKQFLKCFDEPLEKGYVFTFNTDLDKLFKEIKEESCAKISYGFESDTDDKADDVGRNFVEILNNNGYMIEWTELVKDNKIITIVIDEKDIPNFNEYNNEDEIPYILSLTNAEEDCTSSLVQFIDTDESYTFIPKVQEICVSKESDFPSEILGETQSNKKGIYKCGICYKTYKQKKSFDKHNLTHKKYF